MVKKTTPEGVFQQEVINRIKEQGFLVIRNNMGGHSGVPDILFFVNGFAIFAELKRPDGKGKATKQQLSVIEKLREQNVIAGVVSSIKDLDKLIAEAEKRVWR